MPWFVLFIFSLPRVTFHTGNGAGVGIRWKTGWTACVSCWSNCSVASASFIWRTNLVRISQHGTTTYWRNVLRMEGNIPNVLALWSVKECIFRSVCRLCKRASSGQWCWMSLSIYNATHVMDNFFQCRKWVRERVRARQGVEAAALNESRCF